MRWILHGREAAVAREALGVEAILTPPCIFSEWFSINNVQGGIRTTLTSTPQVRERGRVDFRGGRGVRSGGASDSGGGWGGVWRRRCEGGGVEMVGGVSSCHRGATNKLANLLWPAHSRCAGFASWGVYSL